MSVNKSVQTTSDKILNSDIYDLTSFVDDIKKINIDGVDNDVDTLLVGMYGYLGYEFASLLQNSIVVSSELANEAIPTRAKFDRNVITHALSLGIKKVAATAANMKVMIIFPEKALRNNMINERFTLRASTPIYFDEYEFHTDYDIIIDRTDLKSSTSGSNVDYVYTAHYNMDVENPISDIDNSYLPPLGIYADTTDNMVMLITNLHQVSYKRIEEKIVGSDDITNKTLNFTFDDQMSHFSVQVYENNSTVPIELTPVYDGLYNQTTSLYCYYQYINSNTVRIRFDPNSYQPRTNCNVVINLWTTKGYSGNFTYNSDLLVRLTSNEYTNLYMIVKQRTNEGSTGGLDRKSVEELQRIIPKEALSRGSITTLSDLRNYFNSINNEDSVLHVFRKEDNILTRIYYTYCLMKDSSNNVVPTNTIPIYLQSTEADQYNGKIYLESGTKTFYYKNSSVNSIPFLTSNYIGYKDEEAKTSRKYSWDNTPYNFNSFGFENSQYIYFKFYGSTKWRYGVFTLVDEHLQRDKCRSIYIHFYDNDYKNEHDYHIIETLLPNPFNDIPEDDNPETLYEDTGISPALALEILESFYLVNFYVYDNADVRYNFSNLSLVPGDHIKFCLYDNDVHDNGIVNMNRWKLGEVLSIEKKSNRITSIEVMYNDEVLGEFITERFRLPIHGIDDNVSLGNRLNSSDIISLYKTTNFVYVNPLSIVLTDDDTVESHRIDAAYYLEIINENRFLDFKCINSNSPIQYIASYIHVNRPSFLSENRYQYTIELDMTPNIGMIKSETINRTRVIGVFYKDNAPICYSIAKYIKDEDDSIMKYRFKIFTKALSNKIDENDPVTIDEYGCLYISGNEDYQLYEADAIHPRKVINNVYLPENVEFRIYTLYKYNYGGYNPSQSSYSDPLTNAYFSGENTSNVSISEVPLSSIIPGITPFDEQVVPPDDVNEEYEPYTINDMILTNVYQVNSGINLIYNYSNIMNSYVTMIQTNDLYDVENVDQVTGYIVNRVPVLRYFYLNDESKVNTFISEMKRKILYVLDALDPLECTFGLDFKFFNSYGPSNMYHITNSQGEISDLIDNVSLTINFRTKFYNEDNDKESIIPLIKDDIKTYMENIEELNDLHLPNLTTEIETKYSEYIIYFEYISFNIYDANYQHIITDENMEMLTVVPEFLNINIDDYTGLPYINISIVT